MMPETLPVEERVAECRKYIEILLEKYECELRVTMILQRGAVEPRVDVVARAGAEGAPLAARMLGVEGAEESDQ